MTGARRARPRTPASRQPVLRTATGFLEPADRGDLEFLHGLWVKPQVRRYLFDDEVLSVAATADVLETSIRLSDAGCGLWVLVSPEGAVVGCAGLLPVSTVARHDHDLAGLLEPVVALDPGAWRRGHARGALAALVEYAFTHLRVSALAGVHDEANGASRRMLRSCGFEPRGTVRADHRVLCTYLRRSRRRERGGADVSRDKLKSPGTTTAGPDRPTASTARRMDG